MTPLEGDIIPPDAAEGHALYLFRKNLDEFLSGYPTDRDALLMLQEIVNDALERRRARCQRN